MRPQEQLQVGVQRFSKFLSPRVIRFGVVGLSGVVVNLGMLHLLYDVLGMHRMSASAWAIEVSIISNFLLNNAWTFKDKNEQAKASFFMRWARYNLVSLVGLVIQLGVFEGCNRLVMHALELTEPGYWVYPAQLCGIAIAMSFNFFSNFYWTWAQNRATPAESLPPQA